MCHRAALLTALLAVLVCASCASAQTPGLPPLDQQAEQVIAPAPRFAGPAASGESVAALATFISSYLGQTGQVPDLMQVMTTRGELRTLSASEAFVLLARTVSLWRAEGGIPEAVPIAPSNVRPPEIDPEDIPTADLDLSVGREIPTEPFLGQCDAAVEWVDRLRRVPTAIWIGGERLSATEYLAGLAICIEYAYQEGTLLDTVFLPAYVSPHAWLGNVDADAEAASFDEESQEAEASDAEWVEEPERADLEPLAPAEAGQEFAPEGEAWPELVVFPEPGSEVAGRVDLVAGYSGPPASFVMVAVDGATSAIMNVRPYGYRWDTTSLAPGAHTVRITVLGEGGGVLADQVNSYTVVPPGVRTEAEEIPSDL